jgi:hypothetical protein
MKTNLALTIVLTKIITLALDLLKIVFWVSLHIPRHQLRLDGQPHLGHEQQRTYSKVEKENQ